MVRILSAFVILSVVIGLALLGTYGAYVLVLILAALALWEFMGLSEGMGSRAPAWLLFPLGLFFAYSGTVLKGIEVNAVLALAPTPDTRQKAEAILFDSLGISVELPPD